MNELLENISQHEELALINCLYHPNVFHAGGDRYSYCVKCGCGYGSVCEDSGNLEADRQSTTLKMPMNREDNEHEGRNVRNTFLQPQRP
jgi:hypothetical protein